MKDSEVLSLPPGTHEVDRNLSLRIRQGKRGVTRTWLLRGVCPDRQTRTMRSLGEYGIKGKGLDVLGARTLALRSREAAANGEAAFSVLSDGPSAPALTLKGELRRDSFECVARDWFDGHQKKLSNDKNIKLMMSRFERYVFPVMGHRKVSSIKLTEWTELVDSIESRTGELRKRVLTQIRQALDFAVYKGKAHVNPLRTVASSKLSRSSPVEHFRSLPWERAPELYRDLQRRSGNWDLIRLALLWSLLSGARTVETRRLQWGYINSAMTEVRFPAEVMKAKREHSVIITPVMKEILIEARRYIPINTEDVANVPVFRTNSLKRGPRMLSDNAFLQYMRNWEGTDYYRYTTPHGLRATFKTWAEECATDISRVAIESHLAHQMKGAVEQAYNRAAYMDQRRKVALLWEAFLTGNQGN